MTQGLKHTEAQSAVTLQYPEAKARCPTCNKAFDCLSKHYGRSKLCDPARRAPRVGEDAAAMRWHTRSSLQAKAAELLQHLRYDKMLADSVVDELKPALRSVRADELDALRLQLLPLLRPGAEAELDAILATFQDPFYGLGTKKQEHAYAKEVQQLPLPEARVRNLRKPGAAMADQASERARVRSHDH
jgi:hypothetical protein